MSYLMLLLIVTIAHANEPLNIPEPIPYVDWAYTETKDNIWETVEITWRPVTHIQEVCKAVHKTVGDTLYTPVAACAVWKGNKCRIYTEERVSLETVGHEVRHCFQGKWH